MTNGSIGLQDRAEIEWLLSEVIGRRDRDEGDSMAELFTEDAHIVTPHLDLNGRSEIHNFFSDHERAAEVRTQHLWSNLILTSLEDGRVQADSCALTFAVPAAEADKGVMVMIGNWRYVVAMQPEGWRIADQRVRYTLSGRLNPIEGDS
jgi:hypothetical protein